MTGYADYRYWKGWTRKPFGIWPPEAEVYFSEELRRSGIASISGIAVLEIGFGNGEFAGWARKSGAKYVGTEIISDLLQQGLNAGFEVIAGTEPLDRFLNEQSVDLIVAFDVFEHFEADEFRSALVLARRLLRPYGRLIARVPSGDSPFSRAIQHGDATHRATLGSSMIRQLASEAGLTVQSVREPAFPLRGLGAKTFMRRAAVRCIQRIAFPFFTRAFMGGGAPVLTPDLVFVLVKQ